jgi:alpha-acetolactate decarboxylase
MRWLDLAVGATRAVTAIELRGSFRRIEVSTSVASPGPSAIAVFGRTDAVVLGFRVPTRDSSAVGYHLQFVNRYRIFGGRLVDVAISDAHVDISPCTESYTISTPPPHNGVPSGAPS